MCAMRAATATRLKILLRAPERIDYVPFRAAFKDFVPLLAPEPRSTPDPGVLPDRRTFVPENFRTGASYGSSDLVLNDND